MSFFVTIYIGEIMNEKTYKINDNYNLIDYILIIIGKIVFTIIKIIISIIILMLVFFIFIFILIFINSKIIDYQNSKATILFYLNSVSENNENKNIYFKVLDNGRIAETKNVIDFDDDVNIYNFHQCTDSYIDREKNKVLNKVTKNTCLINSVKFEESDLKNKEEILMLIGSLEHDLWNIDVFEVNDRYFVAIALNVNLISPTDFYEYNSNNNRLIFLGDVSDVRITDIKLK